MPISHCAGVRNVILARDISCVNPITNPEAHSGSRVYKGLGIQDPQSTLEYDLATVIAIRTLLQPLTCKMGSSIFAAII